MQVKLSFDSSTLLSRLKGRTLRNIGTLFLWQASLYLVPLITTPYLARVLGVSGFGTMSWALAATAYVSLISEWGFNWSATQRVARYASDAPTLRRIFWDTLTAKLVLAVGAGVVFAAITLVTPALFGLWPVLLACGLQILASVFSVNWFLQGLEKMGAFATASVVGRFLSVPLTLLWVKGPEDVVMAAAIVGGTGLISAGASIAMATRATQLGPWRFSPSGAWAEAAMGWRLFVSNGAISLYGQANIIVVGLVAGPIQAGLFSGADRLRRAVQGVSNPIGTALFPRINNVIATDPARAIALMFKLLWIQGALTLFVSLVFFLAAPMLTRVFLGAEFLAAVPIVQCLSALPFLVGLSNVLGVNMMLPLGMKSAFTLILIVSGLVNIGLLVVLCPLLGGLGAAIAVLMTETLVTLTMAGVLLIRRSDLHALAASMALAPGVEGAGPPHASQGAT